MTAINFLINPKKSSLFLNKVSCSILLWHLRQCQNIVYLTVATHYSRHYLDVKKKKKEDEEKEKKQKQFFIQKQKKGKKKAEKESWGSVENLGED